MSAKTVFITGGSRGIGRAFALEAARQGWNVAFTWARQGEAAQEVLAEARALAPAQRFEAYELDVRNSSAVDALADEVIQTFGSIDAVVPNAGVNLNGLAYSFSNEDWSTVIETNLSGSFYVCRAFLPELVAQRRGRILFLSSVTAEGASGQAAYAASKAGIVGLAKTLAKEYGPKNITANVVVPGYFETDMTKNTMSSSLSEFAVKYCPLRRLGHLDELAKTMCFLIGDGAGFINGDEIRVTGGLDWAP
jgi:NAD(P)-dependent dehydrogenase (short-subunit alcohol dehydrogenase family)